MSLFDFIFKSKITKLSNQIAQLDREIIRLEEENAMLINGMNQMTALNMETFEKKEEQYKCLENNHKKIVLENRRLKKVLENTQHKLERRKKTITQQINANTKKNKQIQKMHDVISYQGHYIDHMNTVYDRLVHIILLPQRARADAIPQFQYTYLDSIKRNNIFNYLNYRLEPKEPNNESSGEE